MKNGAYSAVKINAISVQVIDGQHAMNIFIRVQVKLTAKYNSSLTVLVWWKEMRLTCTNPTSTILNGFTKESSRAQVKLVENAEKYVTDRQTHPFNCLFSSTRKVKPFWL